MCFPVLFFINIPIILGITLLLLRLLELLLLESTFSTAVPFAFDCECSECIRRGGCRCRGQCNELFGAARHLIPRTARTTASRDLTAYDSMYVLHKIN